MSGIDGSPYDDSPSETNDTDYRDTRTRLAATELADEPPAEPMDREDYAADMREGPAADIGDDTSDEYDTGFPDGDGSRWSDPAERAQGMTREDYADYAREAPAADTADYALGDGRDADGTGQLDDAQSEPESPWSDPASDAQGMTREEYAGHTRQGPAAADDAPGAGDSPSGQPSAEERAHLHEMYQDYLSEHGSGWDQGTNVVGDKPDRSPGDTSDLPPAGEELLDMDSDKLSRFARFRKETYKEMDDILDVSEKDGGTISQLFDRPPMGSHTEIPAGHPAIEQPPAPGLDGGHLVVAGLVVGIIGVEAARAVRNTMQKWKGR
jgi:hypothetical protein